MLTISTTRSCEKKIDPGKPPLVPKVYYIDEDLSEYFEECTDIVMQTAPHLEKQTNKTL